MQLYTLILPVRAILISALLLPLTVMAAPKHVLVVSVTTGFRHSCIPTMNKVLGQLAAQSQAFTVDYVDQPPGKPNPPTAPNPPGADATDAITTSYNEAQAKYTADLRLFHENQAQWDAVLASALMKLSAESLSHYDAVIFANTTGDLPIPDRDGFLAWLKSGRAFIGLHAATDTFHGWPNYAEFLGGEFAEHGPQLAVTCINHDSTHPANKHLGATFDIALEEMYQIKKHDPSHEHELLVLDKKPEAADPRPGFYPVSWCHAYGNGKVFYTSLGHREDIIDTDPSIQGRKNPVETSRAYQSHVLGGILWALGLAPGDATPQAK